MAVRPPNQKSKMQPSQHQVYQQVQSYPYGEDHRRKHKRARGDFSSDEEAEFRTLTKVNLGKKGMEKREQDERAAVRMVQYLSTTEGRG